ncbi:hypothetical protein ACN38_g3974 [Penicillium nordicum]|uniref:Uncharacterized protein n=1 Tax=Penicillium nordicum TaxID=229535 RepID=A0A0M9WHH9_9EURO|nr:hypothetical protein ACN38_g3974 [Penicillium nordicum]
MDVLPSTFEIFPPMFKVLILKPKKINYLNFLGFTNSIQPKMVRRFPRQMSKQDPFPGSVPWRAPAWKR